MTIFVIKLLIYPKNLIIMDQNEPKAQISRTSFICNKLQKYTQDDLLTNQRRQSLLR